MFRKLNALLWLRVQVLISNSTLLATLLMPFGFAVLYNEFLNKGNLIEYGSPQDIIQKYHVDKKVRVVYNDGREQIVPFEELPHLDTTDLMVVHSCEPTLEEIFIRLTGEKLDV